VLVAGRVRGRWARGSPPGVHKQRNDYTKDLPAGNRDMKRG